MRGIATAILAVGLLLLLPALVPNTYIVSSATIVMIFVILATGLDLVMGYAGQFSFAQAAFYAVGAYTAAILHRDLGCGFWQSFPLGILIAGVFGLVLGFPSLRLSGHFLAIATIAFQTIVYLILTQWNSFTGGQFGIPVPAIGPATLFGVVLFEIHTPRSFYYLTLAVTLLCVLIGWRLAASRLGTGWEAIREDELLARAIGLNTTRGKLIAFVASAAMAGAAGVLNAFYVEGVSPSDFSIWTSATVVAMVLIGGRGTIFGPIVGAATLTLLPEILRPMQDYRMILFGFLMILTVQFFPKGIWGLFGRPGFP